MRILTLLLIFSWPSLAALSLGDGSDGVCTWTFTQTLPKNSWNCQSISISPGAIIDFAGSDNVVLRSQGEVTIDGTLDVSANGQSGGPGGGDGASSPSGDGVGYFGGEGLGGQSDGGNVGAGGGGAGHNGAGAPGTTPVDPPTPGAGGSGYGSESNFQNEIYGGSGGGAGGNGADGVGGFGGGGGGALVIVAKGNVDISGSLISNGSQGGAATGSFGGGGTGGSGSGGSIYVVSQSLLNISGTISVDGPVGNPDDNFAGGGIGGEGADGRVRLDAPSGNLDTSGSTIPVGTVTATPPAILDPLMLPQSFESDISYACSYKEIKRPEDLLLQAGIGFSLVILIIAIARILLGLRYRQC